MHNAPSHREPRRLRPWILAGTTLAAVLAVSGCTSASETGPPPAPEATLPEPTASSQTLPDEGAQALAPPPAAATLPSGVDPDSDAALAWEALLSPDGEYAAVASYQAVLKRYGTVEPYATILVAELRHVDALVRQLERYGVEVPDNPYIGVVSAPDDLRAAAEAWAEGEILNVAMYDALLADVGDERLARVLSNLRRASLESHLPAFEAAAAAGGALDAMPGNAR